MGNNIKRIQQPHSDATVDRIPQHAGGQEERRLRHRAQRVRSGTTPIQADYDREGTATDGGCGLDWGTHQNRFVDKDVETITIAFDTVPVQCPPPRNILSAHNSSPQANPYNSLSLYRAGDMMQTQPMDMTPASSAIQFRPQIELVFDASGSSTADYTEEYLQKLDNLVLEKLGARGRHHDLAAVPC